MYVCMYVCIYVCILVLNVWFFQTIEDWEFSNQIAYIKLINVGQKVITRNCHGYLPSQVCNVYNVRTVDCWLMYVCMCMYE